MTNFSQMGSRIVAPAVGVVNRFQEDDATKRAEEAKLRRQKILDDRYNKNQSYQRGRNALSDKRFDDKESLLKAQRDALVAMTTTPMNSQEMGVDNTKADELFQEKYGLGGVNYPVGNEKLNTGIQSFYEDIKPTQESAYAGLIRNGNEAGGETSQVINLAKTLSSDYESDADRLRTATALSNADNKRRLLKYKEDRADARKGISTGNKTNKKYSKGVDKVLQNFTAENFGGNDADSLKKLFASAANANVSADELATIYETHKGTGGLFTNGEFNMDEEEVKVDLAKAMAKASTRYNGNGKKVTELEYSTPGQFISAAKRSRDQDMAKRFAEITGRKSSSPVVPKSQSNGKKKEVEVIKENKAKYILPPIGEQLPSKAEKIKKLNSKNKIRIDSPKYEAKSYLSALEQYKENKEIGVPSGNLNIRRPDAGFELSPKENLEAQMTIQSFTPAQTVKYSKAINDKSLSIDKRIGILRDLGLTSAQVQQVLQISNIK